MVPLENAPQSESSFVESKSEEKTSKKDKTTKTDGKGSGKALTVSPLVDALQEMPSQPYERRMARTTILFACRSLIHTQFEPSLNALLASSLPLNGAVLEIIVALVAPPATLRPIGSEQLSESVTAPLLQRVAEHLMMTLNSAPRAHLTAKWFDICSPPCTPRNSGSTFGYRHILCGSILCKSP